MLDTKNQLPDMTDAYLQVQEKKKDKERWQDDDGDGKWYEKSDVDGKISKREKEEKKKNQKEEVEVVDEMHVTASMGRHAKAWREKKAEEQRRKDNPAYYAELDKIRAAKAKRAAKKEKNLASNMKKEEVEINEISPDLALKASKEADKKRGKLAVAGDKAGAAKKSAQASRLYKAQAKKRLNREETEILDDLLESGLFSDEEIEAILKMNEEE